MKTKHPRSFIGDVPILALNWKQPYLDLMFHGKIETRTWPTKYRGFVLMCASKKAYDDASVLSISGSYNYGEVNRLVQKNRLAQAIAIGRLIDCRLMRPEDEEKTFVKYRDPWTELVQKNVTYYDGLTDPKGITIKTGVLVKRALWCHVYENVRPINPVDFSAGQGWSFVPPDILALINYDNNS